MAKLVHMDFKGSRGTSELGILSCSVRGIQWPQNHNHLGPVPCPVGPPAGPLLPLPIEPLREESLPSQTQWVNVAFLFITLSQW